MSEEQIPCVKCGEMCVPDPDVQDVVGLGGKCHRCVCDAMWDCLNQPVWYMSKASDPNDWGEED